MCAAFAYTKNECSDQLAFRERVRASLEAVNESGRLHHVYCLTKTLEHCLRQMLPMMMMTTTTRRKERESSKEDGRVCNSQHQSQIQLDSISSHFDGLEKYINGKSGIGSERFALHHTHPNNSFCLVTSAPFFSFSPRRYVCVHIEDDKRPDDKRSRRLFNISQAEGKRNQRSERVFMTDQWTTHRADSSLLSN